jgi:hypothetical protein
MRSVTERDIVFWIVYYRRDISCTVAPTALPPFVQPCSMDCMFACSEEIGLHQSWRGLFGRGLETDGPITQDRGVKYMKTGFLIIYLA